MQFSNEEIKHLLRAWLMVSAAFGIILGGGLFTQDFAASFIIAAITVGSGFLLHELAHKFLAQRYGCYAEFRAFDTLLIAALLMSFLGFILAAPGAVFIRGRVNAVRNGRISAIGPFTNIVLALLFFAIFVYLSPLFPESLFVQIASYGMRINGWLAFFNLIPVWQLDGAKVMAWNQRIYFLLMLAAFAAAFILPGIAMIAIA